MRVTSAQRAQLCTRLYLYVLSKVATSNQMTENKTDDAQQCRVRPSKHGITTRDTVGEDIVVAVACIGNDRENPSLS